MKKLSFLLIPFLLSITGCVSLLSAGIKKNSSLSSSSGDESSIAFSSSSYLISLPERVYLVGFGGNQWFPEEQYRFYLSDIERVFGLSHDVYYEAQKKDLRAVYFLENINVGSESMSYTTPAVVNGNLVEVNGCYAFKIVCTNSNDDIKRWIPSDQGQRIENLSDNVYIPPHTETPDEYGLNWNNLPVVTSGEGIYTFIFFLYNHKSTNEIPGYGVAAIKTGVL